MQVIRADLLIVGGGGAGLRAAIAAAEGDPDLDIALISKVVPMRSHTVAAEGGAAGVMGEDDSLALHFDDTVAGGDWLCDQDVVEDFVAGCTAEMVQLERWGCPWSRRDDGRINLRFFGGMKVQRTWFAADRTGFHILHTLFQTSLKYPGIRRYDEFFVSDLLDDGERIAGALAIEIASGAFFRFEVGAVVLATGGAGRIYQHNTNAGIVTGEGMALAYRAGVALRDMEFVQYHPTALPGTGILITEGCRGEGGVLINRHGHRYLEDYGLGPLEPWPRPKAMELGPRDRLSQAFWHEDRKGNTVATPRGSAVHLDLRALGPARLAERLPLITELARTFAGVDPVKQPIPVRPAVHYTMGGIATNRHTETSRAGLYAAGECASVGIHGANRLGSNSLAELLVFGRIAGDHAGRFARQSGLPVEGALAELAADRAQAAVGVHVGRGQARVARLREALAESMEEGVGIYRSADALQRTCDTLAGLRAEVRAGVHLDDRNRAFNMEWLAALELGAMLEVAEAIAHSALARRESRGAHQRLDGYKTRDDRAFLCHTLAWREGKQPPRIEHAPVVVTRSPPGERDYGGATAAPGETE